MLGEAPDVFSAGEIAGMWEWAILGDQPCACGRAIVDCEVWGRVVVAPGVADARGMVEWQREAVRTRDVPALLSRAALRRAPRGAGAKYLRSLIATYQALSEVTGADVLVDSSKHPATAALLALQREVHVRYVHLVRDPRAVAHSWQRRKEERLLGGAREMPRWSPSKTALTWDSVNVAAEALALLRPGAVVRVRYEDFAREPRAEIARVLRHAGLDARAVPFVGPRSVELSMGHAALGNPVRFASGRMEIREDAEWTTAQPGSQRAAVTALTLPLLAAYRYAALRPGGRVA